MAKKAKKLKIVKPPKAKAKKAAKSKPVFRGGEARAAAAKKATATPKNVPLFKGLRIRALDKVCEQIADTRGAMNRLRGEEADLERHAHRLMREHKQMTWTGAGVELSRVPGDEKLRVRTSRETSTAPGEGGEASAEEQTDGDINEGADEGPNDVEMLGTAVDDGTDDEDGQVH